MSTWARVLGNGWCQVLSGAHSPQDAQKTWRGMYIVVVFTDAGAFPSSLFLSFLLAPNPTSDFFGVRHLEHATNPLKNYTAVVVETSSPNQRWVIPEKPNLNFRWLPTLMFNRETFCLLGSFCNYVR